MTAPSPASEPPPEALLASEFEAEVRQLRLSELTLWTDTHCHIQYAPDESEETAIVERAVGSGVRRMICVGTDLLSSHRALDIAARHSRSGTLTIDVYATAGLHPHDAERGIEPIRLLLSELDRTSARGSRLVAVGESGLDYHYDHSPRATQRKVFAAQVALANEHDLTLVIHTREAFDDTLAILGSEGVPRRTVFHCFTGGPGDAERCLALGAYLSFSGIITFNNAAEVREAVRICPTDRLLVETDSPYLSPVPFRGHTNEPMYIPQIGQVIAQQQALSLDSVAAATSANAVVAFGLRAD
ncbi:MAG: TatD family hydrolase [Acidimicrobiales bacterium]